MSHGKSDATLGEVMCKVCGEECRGEDDDDDQVECSKCTSWYHFECVGVDSSINDRSWTCDECVQAVSGTAGSVKADSNLTKNVTSSGSNLAKSVMTSGNNLSKSATTKVVTSLGAKSTTQARTHHKEHTTETTNNVSTNNNKNSSKSAESESRNIPEAHQQTNVSQPELMLALLEEQREANKEYLRKKYEILAQMNGANIIQNSTFLEQPNGLTSVQIAARQAIPKDLPTFSGDPEEWPTFICMYENSTNVAGFSDVENMLRLQKALKGRAYELVKDKLLVPSMVNEVINTLKTFFGRPEHILERVIDKVRKMAAPKEKLESLIEYALGVRNVCATMQACKLSKHLENPLLVKELVDKLPNQHKLSWAMHDRDESVPIMTAFSDWIYRLAEAASTVVSPSTSKTCRVNAHVEESEKVSCIVCNNKDHRVAECSEFKKASQDDRWEITKKHKLCRRCLKSHKGKCFSKKECGIDGCVSKHHPLLHKPHNESPVKGQSNSQATVSTHRPAVDEANQFFRIIPVKLYNGSKCVEVFAFLDEGSSVTLIDKNVFRKLQLSGTSDPLCLRWTNETTHDERNSVRASIQISASGNNRKFWLNDVRTVANLSLPRQTIDATLLQNKYKHLYGVPIPSYTNASPVLLIGINNWKLAVPRKLREGNWRDPIASKCILGWSIQGAGGSIKNSFLNVHTCSCDWQELHEAVKDSFNLETVASRTVTSYEETRSMQILEDTCKLVDGRYEVGLLWKNDEVCMPDSYENALKRSIGLQRKMQRDASFKATVNERVENLITKGYAREVSEAELSSKNARVWYLPIFVALNPNKPNKARLVWDAAAKVQGKSLNDFMMTGPDLLTPLCDVLLAFRVGAIAISGDIAEMFHRIKICKEDMHVQRFLWWRANDTEAPTTFVMEAMTFGICCAPCIAHYVRDKNAASFQQTRPRAFEAIQRAHYVDDFIDSMDYEDDVIKLAEDVQYIHKSGGFIIRNWTSNSKNVVRSLQRSCDEVQAPVTLGDCEKVLGMYWDPNKDVFRFICRFARLKRDVFSNDITPTKRETLQVLMSIFDPLGFLAPYTVNLKILLQRIWQLGCSWEDELPAEIYPAWKQWKAVLSDISSINIPRCYSRLLSTASSVQIHAFVDASEAAYAAACYLRVQRGDEVSVSLVAAKCKVAPLKPMSVPRLELQAAIIGARLTKKVVSTRNLKSNECIYWSDSKTVLRWLKMDPRGFNQFVMHRIGELIETTDARQWRWVPSKCNPADLATKIHKKIDEQFWLQGPEFLIGHEDSWPTCTDIGPEDKSETRNCVLHIHRQPSPDFFVEYFSDWSRLYRSVAIWIVYVEKCKARVSKTVVPTNPTYEQLQRAKSALYREAQKTKYQQEICALNKSQPIEERSTLRPLNVYLDSDGVMRIQGRASRVNSSVDAIILPNGHYVTSLVVKNYHELFHHTSHETVVNIIRSKFYIVKLRVLYKTVRNHCQRCKIDNAKPVVPQMAPVPMARLACFERPFSYVGVDYFGPILVTVGRRKEKRWGVLFTCLTLRAVHLEVAHSLDTSSCVMCLRNFIARRGTPKEIYSDNGTNFKATSKTVRDELRKVNFVSLEKKYDGIKWKFNPPSAPHMGGAWERLVRSVKTVLHKICPSETFHDESLRSALCEVEFILNARPLTFVSLDAADDDALTPNHILLGSADGEKILCYDNVDLRTRWRKTQLFADKFWKRWVREYTPNLVRRGKWFSKRPPLRVGDVVIITDENLPRNCWPKGVVASVITAGDGQVRRATIKTKFGLMERPTAKIAVLDVGKTNEGRRSPRLICEGEDVAAES